VVLPIPNPALLIPRNFRTTGLACLSNVSEDLMVRHMDQHNRSNGLLTEFQSGFRWYHLGGYIKGHGKHSIEYDGWTGNGVGAFGFLLGHLIWLFRVCY
jgi:hypothetical protein